MHLALKSTGEQGKKGADDRRPDDEEAAEEEEDPDEEFLFAQLGSKGAFEPSVRREASVASPRSSVAESRTASAASHSRLRSRTGFARNAGSCGSCAEYMPPRCLSLSFVSCRRVPSSLVWHRL